MSYLLTKIGVKECKRYIRELEAKRKEILDAGIDTADNTNIPSVQDIEADISFIGVDEDGDYYNYFGVTDNYDADCSIILREGKDFVCRP